MDNQRALFNKILIIGVLILFIGAIFVPGISGVYNDEEDMLSLTFYTFDKTGTKECKIELSTDTVNIISDTFEELKYKIINDPASIETKTLKNNFIELLDRYNLIPQGLSKDYVVSLLNPKWLQQIGNNNPFTKHTILRSRASSIDNDFPTMQSPKTASAIFCSMAGSGRGLIFTPLIFPRPRFLTLWSSFSSAVSTAANLYTGHGFVASGGQIGIALGFWGIGLSFAIPGEPAIFGFGGYSLLTAVRADEVETYPLNRVPVISDESPSNSSINIPIDLSELSFHISDADGDRMSYTVTTDPDIGGGDGSGFDGVYSVPIDGLQSNTDYSWHVVVTDGEDTSEEFFSFQTEIVAPIVSDSFPVDGDNWVSVDLSKLNFRLKDLQGDLMNYTVETVPDIGSGSGSGVDDGIYFVDISGLDHTTEYTWFVNVTDGKYWTRRVFNFKTQPVMVFDPFDEGWVYRKKITINHNMVDGDLVDFPVLISIVDSDLKNKAQVDGDDILFMDGSGVANRLLHEIEYYEDSSGKLVAWVRIPSLSSTVNNVLYMYYGNSNCDSQQYPDKVWDSDYIHIWHLGDSLEDSKGNNGGNNYGTSIVDGICGRARDLECDEDDYIDFGDISDIGDEVTKTFTCGVWVKWESFGDYRFMVGSYKTYGSPDEKKYVFLVRDTGELRCVIFEGNNIKTRATSINNNYDANDVWYYNVFTFDGSDTPVIDIFVNGSKISLDQDLSDASYIQNTDRSDMLGFYYPEAGKRYSDGVFDEVRWSKVVRSDKWIKTSYNTMNDPSSFFSIGPEESAP